MARSPAATEAREDADAAPRAGAPRKRAWPRVVLGAAAAAPLAVLGLWIAVNRVEWLGPYVANTLRTVIGTQAVTELEDFAYKIQDQVNQVLRQGEKPKAYWDVPSRPPADQPAERQAPVIAPGDEAEADAEPSLPPFRPENVGPVHDAWSAPGDGQWVPMVDPRHPEQEPYMMKTLLHPDQNRSWAEVFVVALDLRRIRLHLVPGSREPKANVEEALDMERPAVIPEEHRDEALAAFNGGFKLEHGRYGMRVGETTLVRPRTGVCAVARYRDDSIVVDTWDEIADTADRMIWWRQAPNCMIEDNELHWRLRDPELAKRWEATLDGETVIRRSAIGISEDGEILYTSISNHTTARVIAEGMRHAGAVTVAQLDVNFSYPKFVTFEPKKELAEGERPKRIAIPLADGFEFSEDEYIRKKARRDFFYVVPREPDAPAEDPGGAG